jgi:ABC-type Mn2+/Zn2+ transport system permease subunit
VVCIQAILRHSRLHEDAAIGIVLSVFFGAGIVGLSYIQANAPAGSAGLNAFIYGQAATMQPGDVLLMGGDRAGGVSRGCCCSRSSRSSASTTRSRASTAGRSALIDL